MIMRRLFVLTMCLSALGCSPRRKLELAFSDEVVTDMGGGDMIVDKVADITEVDVAVYNGNDCLCADVGTKPGCLYNPPVEDDTYTTIVFTEQSPTRTAGAIPDGKLAVHVNAFKGPPTDRQPIALKSACWCIGDVADRELIYPLGSPTDPNGTNCN